MLSEALVSGADPAAPDRSGDDATRVGLPSIDCLPYEVKQEIIRWTAFLPWSATECRKTQQSLSLVNREFGTLVNPFLWSSARIVAPTIEELSSFLDQIIPRYGRHMRNVVCDYREWERTHHPLAFDSNTRSLRRQVAKDIFAGLPSLQHFGIHTSFWPESGSHMTMMTAAAAMGGRLRSVSVIGPCVVDPSYLAAFLPHFLNLETLELAGLRDSESDDFLIALSNLTCLRELSLRRVPLRPTGHLHWLAALTKLSMNDCDDVYLRDAQIFIDAFSSTLTDLSVSVADNDFQDLDLHPFPPSDAPQLEKLRLDWRHAEESPLLTSLAQSPIRYIEITIKHPGVFSSTDGRHLLAALAAFRPTLEEVQLNISLCHLVPRWNTVSKDLTAAFGDVARWCKEQVVEVVFSGNGQDGLRPHKMAWSIEGLVDLW